MSEFIILAENKEGRTCFFEDDGNTGYFYVYGRDGAEIVDDLHIYSYPKKIGVKRKDIEVVWSADGTKCGVTVWGRFYGIFDLAANKKISILVKNKDTPPIEDPALLEGF